MSEERLARIESVLEELVTGQAELRTGQAELRADVTELRTGQAELRAGQAEMQQHLIIVDKRLGKLEVGQEEMRDHIKQIAEGHLLTQAMLKQGFDDLRAHIDRRLVPLERTVREHSKILRRRA